MPQEPNPYLSPSTFAAPPSLPVDAEAIRRQYLNHEASVKSVGTLYLLGGILLAIFGLYFLIQPTKDFSSGSAVVLLLIGGLQLILGNAVRRLQKAARIVAAALAIPGLLGFPIGTLISVVILCLMLSRKGAMVFSDDYKRIIDETPHIKYKTSIVVWIVLGLFVLVLLAGLVLGVFSMFASRQ